MQDLFYKRLVVVLVVVLLLALLGFGWYSLFGTASSLVVRKRASVLDTHHETLQTLEDEQRAYTTKNAPLEAKKAEGIRDAFRKPSPHDTNARRSLADSIERESREAYPEHFDDKAR